ncbi:hypothetical protein ACSFB8_07575 [Enterococcus faecalis]
MEEVQKKNEKKITDLENEINYLNALLELTTEVAMKMLDINRKLIEALKKK